MGGGPSVRRSENMAKWLWKQKWDFSALGGPTRSISRRVVKLAIPHYYSGYCHPQKRKLQTSLQDTVYTLHLVVC